MIMLGNGDGTLQPRVQYPAGGQNMSLAIGDSTTMALSISR